MLDEKVQKALIEQGRNFMKGHSENDAYMAVHESDQELKRPQPPLVKAPMRSQADRILLPKDFGELEYRKDMVEVIRDRKSHRIYSQKEMTLEQLSFLLWATQGVKSIRGKSYATLRTVPCGGARHEFETYLMVRKISGLKPGRYHYLPMEHAVEFLGETENMEEVISESLCGQVWAAKANVVFYWSVVPYRCEWRYGIYAHRTALIDVGHVGQNLYLACTGIGMGGCGIAAFQDEICSKVFELDGEEEFMVYTMPVGTIRESDKKQEQAFYQFIEDEGM